MKKSFLFYALAIVTALLTLASFGCNKQGTEDNSGSKELMAAADVYADVLEVSGFGAMTPVARRDYIEIYGIDANNFEDCAWYVSDNPALNADEVALFLVKKDKEQYADTLVTLLQKHIDTRLNVANSYSPEEAGKLEQVKVTTAECDEGTWVYYCIGAEYAKMMEVLKKDIG